LAETVWLPAVRAEVFVVAIPPESVTGAPKLEPSTINWTVPVGVPTAGEAAPTVAVNVTDCPVIEGLTDEITAVFVVP
jgi:hypothetical protein